MTLTMRPVEPARDAKLIHAWVTQERASFWGMLEKDLEEVEAIYGYIDQQPHLAAYLAFVDGFPIALFQTWDPEVDELGTFYDRRPGDVGVHLLLADDPRRAGRTDDILAFLMAQVFADPASRRIVVEPDARNQKSVDLFVRLGAELGPLIELPHKPAQFAFLSPESCLPDAC